MKSGYFVGQVWSVFKPRFFSFIMCLKCSSYVRRISVTLKPKLVVSVYILNYTHIQQKHGFFCSNSKHFCPDCRMIFPRQQSAWSMIVIVLQFSSTSSLNPTQKQPSFMVHNDDTLLYSCDHQHHSVSNPMCVVGHFTCDCLELQIRT